LQSRKAPLSWIVIRQVVPISRLAPLQLRLRVRLLVLLLPLVMARLKVVVLVLWW